MEFETLGEVKKKVRSKFKVIKCFINRVQILFTTLYHVWSPKYIILIKIRIRGVIKRENQCNFYDSRKMFYYSIHLISFSILHLQIILEN